MSTSLVSQITIGDVESLSTVEKKRSKVGRKPKINEENYLDAVKRFRTTNDKIISDYLGVNRSNINRFRNNNLDVFEKAKEIIGSLHVSRYEAKNMTIHMFRVIPVIQEWEELQANRPVGKLTIQERTKAFYNLCVHLNTHPEKWTLEKLSTFVKEAKKAHNNNQPFIEGLFYLNIKKPIRSFFQLIKGISGELLTSKGIDAGRSKGTGSHSKQKVTPEQRHRMIDALPLAVKEVLEKKKYAHLCSKLVCDEVKGITYFMYYTATRIGSKKLKEQGTLSVRTNNDAHVLSKNEWIINLWDKGRGPGIEWNKMLIDDGLEKIRDYTCKKFDIKLDNVEVETKEIDSYLFPILNQNYELEREIMKLALNHAGCTTTIPNHIWRHTFAQDFLSATDWNYELCASVGGWKDTGTLKLSYGKMSEDARRRGLRKAMNLPVENVTYELRF